MFSAEYASSENPDVQHTHDNQPSAARFRCNASKRARDDGVPARRGDFQKPAEMPALPPALRFILQHLLFQSSTDARQTQPSPIRH
jgi:hypothetical protein